MLDYAREAVEMAVFCGTLIKTVKFFLPALLSE
jgi:hypothetical protein